MKVSGATAVVTGAASGIGRAICVSLARRACNLALADIDEAGLIETERLIASNAIRVTRHKLDVGDAAAIKAFPDQVTALHGGVDLLVNNAGVAAGGAFEEISPEDFEWLMSINFWGVVRMTRAFLPALRQSRAAHIVNLSSLFGLIAPPNQTAYASAKYAVRGFSDALRHELAGDKGAGPKIGVTTVHPGGVRTNIARNSRKPKSVTSDQRAEMDKLAESLLRMPAERAGELIVRAVERRQPRLLIGYQAVVGSALERLWPVSYWKIIGPIVGM